MLFQFITLVSQYEHKNKLKHFHQQKLMIFYGQPVKTRDL